MNDSIRVLLIEDNPGDVRLIQELLAEEKGGSFRLESVDRLSAGVESLSGGNIDVVLLDLGLPDSQGFDTFIKVHDSVPQIPIVILSGLTDEELASRAVREGAQDYLVKGYVGSNLLGRSLRYAIERKQSEEDIKKKNEEIRNMTQQLWQAAKLATMGELASSIAHELNNPLATVSLRVESLIAQCAGDDPRRRELEIIGQEVERMGNLVTNLLQFSRRSQKQISTVDIGEEIEKTVELIHYHLRKNNIQVIREFAPEVPGILADRQQLRQLFLNLFTNASDAMPKGGKLTIRVAAQTEEKKIFIELADTGTGIPPEILPKIMEPFYTTKPERKGTGLGLAICRRIAQEHRGTFDITSEGIPGKGTRVCIALPFSNGNNAKSFKGE
jgi:signal transduction histidine kinase